MHDRYFNPRSRGGSDAALAYGLDVIYISIHAPAEGATKSDFAVPAHVSISIHAPAEGATSH